MINFDIQLFANVSDLEGLEAAINNNDTIINLSAPIKIAAGTTVTLNLNGHNIINNSGTAIIVNGELNITGNGTIIGYTGIENKASGTVTINKAIEGNGVTIEGNGDWGSGIDNYGSLIIKAGSVIGNNTSKVAITNNKNGRIEITGGTFSSDVTSLLDSTQYTSNKNDEGYYEVISIPKVCRVDETEYTSIAAAIQAINNDAKTGTITLIDNVSEDVNIPEGNEITLDLAGKNITGNVSNNGEFTISNSNQNNVGKVIGEFTKTGTLNITGGTFSYDITSLLDSTQYTSNKNDEGYYEVISIPKVCRVDETEYTSIAAAIQAINNGTKTGIIILTDDITENINIPEGYNITLELAGKKITGDITNRGNLSISNEENEEINGTIYNFGIISINEDYISLFSVDNYFSSAKEINGNNKTYYYPNLAIALEDTIGTNAIINIYGEHEINLTENIILVNRQLKVINGASVKINGSASITSSSAPVIDNEGTLTIESGSFISSSESKTAVSGNGKFKITGGTFSSDVRELLDKDNYDTYISGENYEVTQLPEVCEVNGIKYRSVSAALKAIGSGTGTIIMTSNVTLKEPITITSSKITVELNGNTIQTSDNSNIHAIEISEGAELTLKDSSETQTGTIRSYSDSAINNFGTVNIESGNFIGGSAEHIAITQSEGSSINIIGGSFSSNVNLLLSEDYQATQTKGLDTLDDVSDDIWTVSPKLTQPVNENPNEDNSNNEAGMGQPPVNGNTSKPSTNNKPDNNDIPPDDTTPTDENDDTISGEDTIPADDNPSEDTMSTDDTLPADDDTLPADVTIPSDDTLPANDESMTNENSTETIDDSPNDSIPGSNDDETTSPVTLPSDDTSSSDSIDTNTENTIPGADALPNEDTTPADNNEDTTPTITLPAEDTLSDDTASQDTLTPSETIPSGDDVTLSADDANAGGNDTVDSVDTIDVNDTIGTNDTMPLDNNTLSGGDNVDSSEDVTIPTDDKSSIANDNPNDDTISSSNDGKSTITNFSNTSGKQDVTISNDDEVMIFNDEGGNIARITDTITGNKIIQAGNGGDMIINENKSAKVTIKGGSGNDTIVASGSDSEYIELGGGRDIVIAGSGANVNDYDVNSGAGFILTGVDKITEAFIDGSAKVTNNSLTYNDNANLNISRTSTDTTVGTFVNVYSNAKTKIKTLVGWADSNGNLNASEFKSAAVLIGNSYNDSQKSSTIVASSNDNTIFAGVNDVVSLNGGADLIFAPSGAVVENYDVNSGAGFIFAGLDNIPDAIESGIVQFSNNSISYNNGSAITLNSYFDDENTSTSANLYDSNGNITKVTWSCKLGGEVDVSYESNGSILVGNYNEDKIGTSTLIGSSYDDTIMAGSNDEIHLSGGNDNIILSGDRTTSVGAALNLNSDTNGNATVSNFKSGFDDNSDSVAIDNLDELQFDFVDGQLNLNYNDLSLVFDDDERNYIEEPSTEENDHNYSLMMNVAGDKVKTSFIGKNSTISADSDYGDIEYYGSGSSVVDFESLYVENSLDVSIGDNFHDVASVVGGSSKTSMRGYNSGTALVAGIGSTTLIGSENDDILYTYSGSDKSNSNTFILGTGRDIVANFDFGSSQSSDRIVMKDFSGYAFQDNALILNDESNSLRIEDAKNQIIRAELNGNIGLVEIGNDLKYDSKVQIYGDISNSNNKLTIDDSMTKTDVAIYMNGAENGKSFDGKSYYNVNEIDASNLTHNASLAGADNVNDTLRGGQGVNKLWGGFGGDDELIGGSGQNTFYYALGDGNDTIVANNGDIIELMDISLDDINLSETKAAFFNTNIKFTNGENLKIVSFVPTDVNFKINGETWKIDLTGTLRKQ